MFKTSGNVIAISNFHGDKIFPAQDFEVWIQGREIHAIYSKSPAMICNKRVFAGCVMNINIEDRYGGSSCILYMNTDGRLLFIRVEDFNKVMGYENIRSLPSNLPMILHALEDPVDNIKTVVEFLSL